MNDQVEEIEAQAAPGYTEEDEKERAELEYAKARKDFWRFRLLMRPQMLNSWWQQDVAAHL